MNPSSEIGNPSPLELPYAGQRGKSYGPTRCNSSLAALDQLFVNLKQWLLGLLGWAPEWVVTVASALINVSGVLGVFLGCFALVSLVERKVLARIQNRIGPNRVGPFGLFQPAADGIKMLIKEDIVPHKADKVIHFLAPIAMVAPSMAALGVIPYGRGMTALVMDAGILLFFAVGSATEVAVFMAGWGSNNKYSMLGAMRAIAQMVSYELPLFLASVPVIMAVGSLSPDAIVAAQGFSGAAWGAEGGLASVLPRWFVFTPWGAVAFVIFLISALVESNRTPFDLPEGESELVAGFMTEYSGFKYAIFFMAEYFGMFAIGGLAVTLFLGGWHAPFGFLTFLPSWMWFFLKLAMMTLLFIWVRGTLPRIRVDQVTNFSWKFMLPMSFACILASALWHYSGRAGIAWLVSLVVVTIAYLFLSRILKVRKKFATRTYRFAD
jgi:NADH-quinone oxidoreductase subunit H